MFDDLPRTRKNFSLPVFIDQEMKDSGLNISEWITNKWIEDNYATESLKKKIEEIDNMIIKKDEMIKRIADNEKFIDLSLTPMKTQEINFFRRLDIQLKRNEGDDFMYQDILNKALGLYYHIYNKRVSRNVLLARLKAYRKNIVNNE